MLGDVHLAEPGALVGFAGPRVIEQTIREKLPEGFQRSEYLRDHGMVDIVVHRHKLRETVARLCRLTMKLPPPNHPPLEAGTNGAARNGGNGAAGEPTIAPPRADQNAAAAN
jgi:acetyl-CoA carboxylase carboxyl transferase subunit beta